VYENPRTEEFTSGKLNLCDCQWGTNAPLDNDGYQTVKANYEKRMANPEDSYPLIPNIFYQEHLVNLRTAIIFGNRRF
jgi:hypothetical protein